MGIHFGPHLFPNRNWQRIVLSDICTQINRMQRAPNQSRHGAKTRPGNNYWPPESKAFTSEKWPHSHWRHLWQTDFQRARCSTEQQTIQHQSAVISKAPVQGKEKTPELDDGGTGGGPGRDDGGGGGGGGWGGWSGGFFLFGFLAFLGFLQDRENEGPYADDRKMKRQAQQY